MELVVDDEEIAVVVFAVAGVAGVLVLAGCRQIPEPHVPSDELLNWQVVPSESCPPLKHVLLKQTPVSWHGCGTHGAPAGWPMQDCATVVVVDEVASVEVVGGELEVDGEAVVALLVALADEPRVMLLVGSAVADDDAAVDEPVVACVEVAGAQRRPTGPLPMGIVLGKLVQFGKHAPWYKYVELMQISQMLMEGAFSQIPQCGPQLQAVPLAYTSLLHWDNAPVKDVVVVLVVESML